MTATMPRAISTAKANGKPATAAKANSTTHRVTKPAQKPTATKKAVSKTVATKKVAKTEPEPSKTAAKKSAPKKSAPKKTTINGKADAAPAPVKKTATVSRKRARGETEEPEEPDTAKQPQKRRKASKTPEPVVVSKTPKIAIGRHLNSIPTQRLDMFVMGDGANSELGLGPKVYDGGKRPREVKRPRINHNLSAKDVGVVVAAAGGMHSAVITHDNRILTWGNNDGGALGRDVTWDGGLRDMKTDGGDSDTDSDAGDLNPFESVPMPVDSDYFAKGTKFVQVVGSDSATFVLTEDGRVYGWGSFRDDNGILGFTQDTITKIQNTPMLIPGLSKITKLAAGDNHILALDNKGKVWAWGAGAQSQLGRRIVERTRHMGLQPCGVGLKNIIDIACGAFHSLAIDKDGRVWAWGSNSNFNCGIDTGAGESNTFILTPTAVDILKDYKITMVAGGNHHSIACTEDGKLLTWGTNEGHQLGMSREDFDAMNAAKPDSVVYHEKKNEPLMVRAAAEIPTERISNVKAVFSGVDNNFALTADGKVYSWGYNSCYQTGQGPKDFVDVPTVIDNSAIIDRKIVWAGAGGQFSLLAALPTEE